MGSHRASEVAWSVRDGQMSLGDALHEHLFHNLYPPLPRSMISVAKLAIEHASRGDWDTMVSLPIDVTRKNRREYFEDRVRGHDAVPARLIIKELHLDFFVEEGWG